MGKYMKKGKLISEKVSVVMEIQQQQQQSSSVSLGVRTRARTLALQPNPDLSYLQLRSRRLEKQPSNVNVNNSSNNNSKGGSKHRVDSVSTQSPTRSSRRSDQASFADNHLEFQTSERGTRESTPCSLIRNTEAIGTPGSSTRRTCSAAANRRPRDMQRTIPTTPEMEEFFAGFELHQQELFLQKYNYDIVNDMPLPGRYDWVRVDN